MPIDSKPVGANERYVFIDGDTSVSGNTGSVLAFGDGTSLAGKFIPIKGNVVLLYNAGGTVDVARSSLGVTGIQAVSVEGTKITYTVCGTLTPPVATPTDLMILNGSATKTIRVNRVTISAWATASATRSIQLLRRSTANTGGTSTTPATATHDTGNAGSSAVALLYTANPSPVGTLTAVIRSEKLNLGPAGSAGRIEWTFGEQNDQALVLRGVAQGIAINFGGAAVPAGMDIDMNIEFCEDAS